MLKLLMFFNILKHPITTYIVLVPSRNTKKSSVIADNSSAKFRNVVFEINQILGLFMSGHIVKVNIFVTPFEVMNYTFISQFFLHNKYILEKVYDSLFDVKMIKFSDHSFLVFEVFFILINKSIPFIDDVSYIIKNSAVSTYIQLS